MQVAVLDPVTRVRPEFDVEVEISGGGRTAASATLLGRAKRPSASAQGVGFERLALLYDLTRAEVLAAERVIESLEDATGIDTQTLAALRDAYRGALRRGKEWIEDVRAKSLALTDFFLECVRAYVPAGVVESLTPEAHDERGSQVALRCEAAPAVMAELIARGVVGDLRRPDVLRFGFTPLYVGFADAERAARVLAEVVADVMGGAAGAADGGRTV